MNGDCKGSIGGGGFVIGILSVCDGGGGSCRADWLLCGGGACCGGGGCSSGCGRSWWLRWLGLFGRTWVKKVWEVEEIGRESNENEGSPVVPLAFFRGRFWSQNEPPNGV